MKIDVYNLEGKVCEELELNDDVFAVPLHEDLISRSVILHLEKSRQGTQKSKTRSEVSGGGRKPYRQKGTGRARQGSIRAPHYIGGGVAFAPKPREYGGRMNKKMRQLAMKSALSLLAENKQLIVMQDLDLPEAKTREMVKVMKALDKDSALVVTETPETKVIRAAANIPNVKTAIFNSFNVYDLLKYKNVIITKDAVKKIEEVYA